MRIFKLFAFLIGAGSLLFSASSCKKDDGQECCTATETYDGITVKYTACEDGTLSYTYTGDDARGSFTSSWTDDFDNWADVKEYAIDEGASCN
jgi:hypothetical protein